MGLVEYPRGILCNVQWRYNYRPDPGKGSELSVEGKQQRPLGRIAEERVTARAEERVTARAEDGRLVALDRKRVARVVPWYTALGEDQVGKNCFKILFYR